MGGEPPGDLAGRRRARRGGRGVPPVLVAALVVIGLTIGIVLVVSGRHQRTQRQAEPNRTTAPAHTKRVAPNTRSAQTEEGCTPTGLPSLGSYRTKRALVQGLAQHSLPGPSTSSSGQRPSCIAPPKFVSRCLTVAAQLAPRPVTDGTPVGQARLAGRLLLVYRFGAPARGDQPGATLVMAVDRTSCRPVLTRVQ